MVSNLWNHQAHTGPDAIHRTPSYPQGHQAPMGPSAAHTATKHPQDAVISTAPTATTRHSGLRSAGTERGAEPSGFLGKKKRGFRDRSHLVEILVVEQVGLAGLEAVLALALVEDVGLELPARVVLGGHGAPRAAPRPLSAPRSARTAAPPPPRPSRAAACAESRARRESGDPKEKFEQQQQQKKSKPPPPPATKTLGMWGWG